MQIVFTGLLLAARPAVDKNKNIKQGEYKLLFLDTSNGGQFEVNSTVLPADNLKYVPFTWAMECSARMFQGLAQLTALSVHGDKPKAS